MNDFTITNFYCSIHDVGGGGPDLIVEHMKEYHQDDPIIRIGEPGKDEE